MASWQEFHDETPELARRVSDRLLARRHLTMATVRRDGSPRICGTEIVLRAGWLLLCGTPGARRFADLRRDPRLCLHSGSAEPPEWTGDARIAGTAVEILAPEVHRALAESLPGAGAGPFDVFAVLPTEATLVGLSGDGNRLVIETWRPGEPVRRFER